MIQPLTSVRSIQSGLHHVNLLRGMVSYWPLTEASGTRYDAHDGKHLTVERDAGTLVGLVYPTAFKVLSKSNLKRVVDSSFNFTQTGFTLAGWIFVTATVSNLVFINGIDWNLTYTLSTNSKIRFVIGYSSPYTTLNCTNFGVIPLSTWIFLVANLDLSSRTMSVKFNDQVLDSMSCSGMTYHTGSFQLGGSTVTGSTGRMGPFALWNRTLTSKEQQALYNNGLGLKYTACTSGKGLSRASIWTP